jgi:hypothetical protein
VASLVEKVRPRVSEALVEAEYFQSFGDEGGAPHRVVAITERCVYVFDVKGGLFDWSLGDQLAVCDRASLVAIQPKPWTRFITIPYFRRLRLTVPSHEQSEPDRTFELIYKPGQADFVRCSRARGHPTGPVFGNDP